MAVTQKKPITKKQSRGTISSDDENSMWVVVYGTLARQRGRPQGGQKVEPLFKCVGQKIPFGYGNEILDRVEEQLKVEEQLNGEERSSSGVYALHDSMGVVRYVGRGSIFARLRAHKKAHDLEYEYFSFWLVVDKHHEREIETLLIRGAGPLLVFNERKKRVGIESGDITDYEPGTLYFERQRKRGRRASEGTVQE